MTPATPLPRLKLAGWLYEFADDRGDATNEIRWRFATSIVRPSGGPIRNIQPLYRIIPRPPETL